MTLESRSLPSRNEHAMACERLLRVVDAEMRDMARQTGEEALSPRVRAALQRVPRERFLPRELQWRAYEDTALPIGHGQTISQPTVVALMTQLLAAGPHERVLEIGTGCGYQTAVLAALAGHVYTVELIGALSFEAHARLRAMGINNVEYRVADGHLGWPEAAPFDAVLVTAADARLPAALVEQLKPHGRIVAPIGRPHEIQRLQVMHKDAQGVLEVRSTIPVSFVPFAGA
jgi:protein-L-isoaspartate(D-aspartate) O-methyltransferase